ncbi:unknown [Clostridium sp. CAG:307]|nr:unknown [Clostridium sp. CAG:307]
MCPTIFSFFKKRTPLCIIELLPYYAIEEAYNDVSKKYLSYYNQDNMQKDISYDTRKLFAKEYILNNIDYYKQIIDFTKHVLANKIKTGCQTSDEAAKSFILRNKKDPYIMKHKDLFTKEVTNAYEFYDMDY